MSFIIVDTWNKGYEQTVTNEEGETMHWDNLFDAQEWAEDNMQEYRIVNLNVVE